MTSRGVLYITWGERAEKVLGRSIESLRRFHPDLPVEVRRLPGESTFLNKVDMFEFSPFEETLYLDADTVVLDKLDFAFEKAAAHGLACSICECPWARRYDGILGDMVEYNSGVLFFSRKAAPVFEHWKKVIKTVGASTRVRQGNQVLVAPNNDQASFAVAVDETRFVPFVLPCNWNFRPRWMKTFFGPLKIWHDYEDVPPALAAWNAQQAQPGVIIDMAALQ
ncbi:MAG: hypothetical protein U0573_13860 [Phycisphaerales bacterium]|nr:hypothetical protein [Planctomycetota bacterium]